jgi:hypothetical protein
VGEAGFLEADREKEDASGIGGHLAREEPESGLDYGVKD